MTEPLPAGFTLDTQEQEALPAGFTLDSTSAKSQAMKPDASQAKKELIKKDFETGNAYDAVIEPALKAASSIPATVAGAGASLYGLATAPSGLKARTADDYAKATQAALTYEPRTKVGKLASEYSPLSLIGKGIDYAGNKAADKTFEATGNEGLAATAAVATEAIPNLFGAKGGASRVPRTPPALKETAAALKPKAPPSVQDAIVDRTTKAGFYLTPTQLGKKAASGVEVLVGRPQLERQISLKNAEVVESKGKKALGIAEDKALNAESIAEVEGKSNAVYKELASTGQRVTSDAYREEVASITNKTGAASFPKDVPPDIQQLKESYSEIKSFDANDAVNKIRQLRKEGRANARNKYDPEKNAKGSAQLAIAEALDNELERHVESLGKPDLVDRYRDARVSLAKAHSVRAAMRGGKLSPQVLSQMKSRGVPLSSELKEIADAYDAFDRSFQDPRKVRTHGPFSRTDLLVGLASIHNPAILAGIAASPLTRKFFASKRYQRNQVPKTPLETAADSAVTPKEPVTLKDYAPPTVLQDQRQQ